MYVVAVDDDGEERNFLATAVEIADGTCLAAIKGLTSVIPLSQLMNIVSVHVGYSPEHPRTVPHCFGAAGARELG